MAGLLFALLIAGACVAPAAADGGDWTVGQMLSIASVVEVVGSLFFAYIGVRGEKSCFILFGNAICIAGNLVWVVMLVDMDGSSNWTLIFLGLAVVNVVGVVAVGARFSREGCFDGDDSESEDEGEGPVAHPDAVVGPTSTRAPVPPAPDRVVARRDKRARLKLALASDMVDVGPMRQRKAAGASGDAPPAETAPTQAV